MLPSDPDRFTDDDLNDVARLLRDNRPEASALELDAVKRQVRSRAARPSQKGSTSMKSRIAMTAMLVSGLLMSGTGAGLAVSGLGQSENASSAQYNVATPTPTPPPTTPVPAPTPPDENDTLPTSTESPDVCDENADGVISPAEALKNGCGDVASETDSQDEPRTESAPNSDTAPNSDSAPANREEAAQPARQVASSDDELPFTGFAAVPILVGGIALLAGGLVLRRRTV